MPANKPFISKAVIEFATAFNEQQLTPAEIRLRDATLALPDTMTPMKDVPEVVDQHIAAMETSDAQAHLMELLTKMLAEAKSGPLKAIDVGTFTGRSAGALAKGMVHGGKVYSCDMPRHADDERFERWQSIAHAYWNEEVDAYGEKIAGRVEAKIGSGHDTMDALLKEEAGTFDIIFIDAEKSGYPDYYEKAKQLVRPGGLILLDNMLWSGRVADPSISDIDTDTLRTLNNTIANDASVKPILLDGDDGLIIACKVGPLEQKIATSAGRQHGR